MLLALLLEMAGLALRHLSLEQLQPILAVAAVEATELPGLGVLVVAVLAPQLQTAVMEQPTLEAAVVEPLISQQVAQAAPVWSSFATLTSLLLQFQQQALLQ